MEYLKVKGWERHQHYKGRKPPWIKLYGDVFLDHDFTSLSDLEKLHLLSIWVLARLKDGIIPNDPTWVKKAACLDADVSLEVFINKGFLIRFQVASNLSQDASNLSQDASNLSATCQQSASLEEERREETEKRREEGERRHQPDSILEEFTPEIKTAAVQAAIAYQTRRYGGPNPSATWYPNLLREAAAVFEVHKPPGDALEKFKTACLVKPTLDMPRDATFSQLAVNCGIKKGSHMSREPPWETAKRQKEEDGRKKLHDTIDKLFKVPE